MRSQPSTYTSSVLESGIPERAAKGRNVQAMVVETKDRSLRQSLMAITWPFSEALESRRSTLNHYSSYFSHTGTYNHVNATSHRWMHNLQIGIMIFVAITWTFDEVFEGNDKLGSGSSWDHNYRLNHYFNVITFSRENQRSLWQSILRYWWHDKSNTTHWRRYAIRAPEFSKTRLHEWAADEHSVQAKILETIFESV